MGVTMAVLSDQDVQARLEELAGWERDGDAIVRQFEFKDFVGSVDFVNRITPLAEEMNHHPGTRSRSRSRPTPRAG
jgi:4a-hydroxytetrahydrobiopterin dehydratase